MEKPHVKAQHRIDLSDIGEVEKGVKLPPLTRKSASKYAFLSEMEIGDSRFIRTPAPIQLRTTIRQAAMRQGKAIDCRIEKKKIDGKEVDGLRVWRVLDRHPPDQPKPPRKAAHK